MINLSTSLCSNKLFAEAVKSLLCLYKGGLLMSAFTINYNENILKGTLETLDSSELKRLVHSGMKVSIKPNMVLAKPPSQGATTHSEIVEGLICYLKDIGVNSIEIIESAWIGDDTKRVYKVCGYNELSKKYNVPLFDLKEDSLCKIDTGAYQIEVCKRAVDTDFLINVPVLKAHCQTQLTCNLKNLKGCISDREKRRFHTLGLHRPIAYLNKAIKTHFCVVDGICGDLTFEEGGNPITRNMILAGSDPLLLDSYCAELIGYKVHEIEYLSVASEIGIGQLFDKNTEITELNKDNKPKFTKSDSNIVKRLSGYINEDMACSACYSALVYALHNTGIHPAKQKINIGQGFRGKKGILGCGNCTSGCDYHVEGCPPKAVDIAGFLKQHSWEL